MVARHVGVQLAGAPQNELGRKGQIDWSRASLDREVPLVAVEPARHRLVSVSRFGIDCREHTIRRYPARAPENAALTLLRVLANHRRHERERLMQSR